MSIESDFRAHIRESTCRAPSVKLYGKLRNYITTLQKLIGLVLLVLAPAFVCIEVVFSNDCM